MFDMTDIGKKIAKRRKELNLTQVELADQLLVSYQAVSQWELGKSMPELSNLTRLADILDIPLDELLGQKSSRVVDQVIKEEPLPEDDLIEAAPFIKPQAMEGQLRDRIINSASLISLAPFLDSSTLMRQIERGPVDSTTLIALAPFLDEEHLSRLLDELIQGEVSTGQLIALAPFASSNSLARLIERSAARISGTQLIALAPFLESEDLGRIVQQGKIKDLQNRWILTALAPFIDQADLTRLVEQDVTEPLTDDVEFISDEADDPRSDDSLEGLLEKLKHFLKSDS